MHEGKRCLLGGGEKRLGWRGEAAGAFFHSNQVFVHWMNIHPSFESCAGVCRHGGCHDSHRRSSQWQRAQMTCISCAGQECVRCKHGASLWCTASTGLSASGIRRPSAGLGTRPGSYTVPLILLWRSSHAGRLRLRIRREGQHGRRARGHMALLRGER